MAVHPSSRSLFEMADRGGLSSPTEMCFAVTAIAVQYYHAVMLNQSVMAKLLLEKNQRATFVEAACTVASSSTEFSSIATHQCAAGHVNFQLNLQRVFNCFAKNELKRLNISKIPIAVTKCKVKKLNSESNNMI